MATKNATVSYTNQKFAVFLPDEYVKYVGKDFRIQSFTVHNGMGNIVYRFGGKFRMRLQTSTTIRPYTVLAEYPSELIAEFNAVYSVVEMTDDGFRVVFDVADALKKPYKKRRGRAGSRLRKEEPISTPVPTLAPPNLGTVLKDLNSILVNTIVQNGDEYEFYIETNNTKIDIPKGEFRLRAKRVEVLG